MVLAYPRGDNVASYFLYQQSRRYTTPLHYLLYCICYHLQIHCTLSQRESRLGGLY